MVEIVADIHERDSRIAARLREMGWIIQETALDAGDYRLGGTVGIERKTTVDFATSLTHGRLFRQLAQLKQSVQKPLLIVEGDKHRLDGFHPHAINGTLVSVSVGWSIPILWSQGTPETSMPLHLMAKQMSAWRPYEKPVKAKKPQDKQALQRQIMAQIPQIGPYRARAPLTQFGTLEEILASSESDLQQVKGIGRKRAAMLYQLLHEPTPTYRA